MEQFQPQTEPAVALIRMEGSLVRHEDIELEALIHELIARNCRRFILDFSLVEFIDSAGIGLIIKIASITDKHKGGLLLCNPQKNVRNVFSMLGIESRFKIYNSLADAIMAFGRLIVLEIISVKF